MVVFIKVWGETRVIRFSVEPKISPNALTISPNLGEFRGFYAISRKQTKFSPK